MKFSVKFSQIRTILSIFGLTLAYAFILAGVVASCLPIYLYRLIVSQLKRFCRPDLSHLVDPRSVVLAVDGFPSTPKWNLVVWLSQDRILSLPQFRTYFETKFVRATDSNGELRYPEYQQYLERWMGFLFWKWDFGFNIRNHIRTYCEPGVVVDDPKLLGIIKELTSAPWHPTQSPWEFLQIPNYVGENSKLGAKSVLILRLHHVLGDGYFILKLLMEDISGISLGKAAQPRQTPGIQKSRLLCRILAAPSNFMKMILGAKDENPWHVSGKMLMPVAALSNRIPLQYLKSIRDSFDVSLTAVINAAVAGGMRRLMIQTGVDPPAEIHQAVPIPMAGHPGKLCNHFIFSFISLPIGIQDPVTRLRTIENNLQALKTSFVPALTFWKVPLIGSLLPCLMPLFTTNHLTTSLMSNFPGTPEVPQFREVKVVDMMFGAGLGPGSTGIGFTLISYVGFIRFLSVADPRILHSDDAVKELNEKIMQELDLLHRLGVGRDAGASEKHEKKI